MLLQNDQMGVSWQAAEKRHGQPSRSCQIVTMLSLSSRTIGFEKLYGSH
jgi:hypothetical protein